MQNAARELVPVRAWWRERMMWLVVGGPAAVVVASFVTLYLAITRPDPVIETNTHLSADSAADGEQGTAHPGMQPALKARNHAATGGDSSQR